MKNTFYKCFLSGRLYYVYKMKINREIGTNGTEGFDNDVTPDMVMELNDDDSIKFGKYSMRIFLLL